MSNVLAMFQGEKFDRYEVDLLQLAYDKARRSLHDRGQPPVVQEIIARRIIDAAKHGERDPDKLCEAALSLALGNKAVYER